MIGSFSWNLKATLLRLSMAVSITTVLCTQASWKWGEGHRTEPATRPWGAAGQLHAGGVETLKNTTTAKEGVWLTCLNSPYQGVFRKWYCRRVWNHKLPLLCDPVNCSIIWAFQSLAAANHVHHARTTTSSVNVSTNKSHTELSVEKCWD